MAACKVIVVLLRRPGKDPEEMRTDPLWEFGSFGCTGCHRKNLMHPARIGQLEGARLAFAQGGHAEVRLVLLTPPVTVVKHRDRCKVRWKPRLMPFRYVTAPLMVDNEGHTDFPSLMEMFASADRSTLVGCFASRFRSRCTPLPDAVVKSLVRQYDRFVKAASKCDFANRYEEALPYPSPQSGSKSGKNL